MLDSNEWWQSCDTIKLYKADAERGKKDTELLAIDVWDNESEFLDLIILMRLYLKGDKRVKNVVQRIRENLP